MRIRNLKIESSKMIKMSLSQKMKRVKKKTKKRLREKLNFSKLISLAFNKMDLSR